MSVRVSEVYGLGSVGGGGKGLGSRTTVDAIVAGEYGGNTVVV